MKLVLAALLYCLICPSLAFGAGLELFSWHTNSTRPPIIIAVKSGETPQAAAKRYLENVRANPDFKDLLVEEELPSLKFTKFEKVSQSSGENRVLVIANSPKDIDGRLDEVFRIFKAEGLKPYVLPFSANLGLDEIETRRFQLMLNDDFERMMAVGGADVDPRIFNEPNYASKNTIYKRDLFEAGILKEKLKRIQDENSLPPSSRKSQLAGICRGAQMIAGLLGYEIGQDISKDVPDHIRHRKENYVWGDPEPTHDVKVLSTSSSFLKNIVQAAVLRVNTYHHQFIRFRSGGPLELAAVARDGIPEALESADSRILLFQFHPELMLQLGNKVAKKFGRKLLSAVAQGTAGHEINSPRSCRAVFR